MITEAEFEQFKGEANKKRIKQARKMATIYSVLVLTALIALIYAFFQHAAAEKTAIEAIQQRVITERAVEEARQARALCAASMKQLQEELSRSQKKETKH